MISRIFSGTFFLLFLWSGNAFAQSVITDKAVIRNNRMADFGLIRSGKEHYILYHQNLGTNTWNVSLFNDDHQRRQVWSYMQGIKGGLVVSSPDSDQGLLFFQKDFRSPSLIWLDPSEPDSFRILEFSLNDKLEAQSLWIFGETAWIGASHKLNGYILLKVNLSNGTVQKLIPGRSERLPLEVHDIKWDKEKNVFVLLLRFKSKRQSVFWVQKMSVDAQPIGERMRINQKEALYSASMVQTSKGWFITGSLSLDADKSINGFYTCTLDDELKSAQLTTSTLQSIPHFFQYLNMSDQQRIFQNAETLNKYKRSYEINTRMHANGALYLDGRVLVAYEFYYPTFIQRTQFGPHGWNTYQEFDGFQYTHAVIFEYSENGQLIRDYCLPMSFSRKPFTEQKQLFWYLTQEGVMAAYMDAEVLRTSLLSGDASLAVFKTEYPIAREDVSGTVFQTSSFSPSFMGNRMIGVLFRKSRQVFSDNDSGAALFLLRYLER